MEGPSQAKQWEYVLAEDSLEAMMNNGKEPSLDTLRKFNDNYHVKVDMVTASGVRDRVMGKNNPKGDLSGFSTHGADSRNVDLEAAKLHQQYGQIQDYQGLTTKDYYTAALAVRNGRNPMDDKWKANNRIIVTDKPQLQKLVQNLGGHSLDTRDVLLDMQNKGLIPKGKADQIRGFAQQRSPHDMSL
jgi:hypothetical protein